MTRNRPVLARRSIGIGWIDLREILSWAKAHIGARHAQFFSIAALCGEGLRPELRELFERLIDPHSGLHIRSDGMVQACPDPVSKASTRTENINRGTSYMSKESDDKAIVGSLVYRLLRDHSFPTTT